MYGRDCAETARALEGELRHLGVAPHPSSHIAQMIRGLGWLASFGDEALQPHVAHAANIRRSLRAFPYMVQARELAVDLRWVRGVPGAGDVVRRIITKALDRNRTQAAPARDHLFEIHMAARLVRSGCRVTCAEPDLVWTRGPADAVGFACKRPKNVRRLRERIAEGARQIERSGLPGVVLIDVEPLFHRSDDFKRPTVSWVMEPQQAEAEAFGILNDAVRRAEGEIERALGGGALGVHFSGLLTGWGQTQTFWRRIRGGRFRDAEDGEALDRPLFDG